ncbi:helix-turn-helix transcriptional regulator [Micromonospora sp. NPDC023888]|uniref:helix-turn-helix domain-containing protein n=1 Tax=Micromonospora sp. NPDC023888 TaxID=3155607 RepID=UPI003403E110
MTTDDLPIGRRVARWRVRRSMTQQQLADRLCRSKSWVDKVERGVRSLDRYSVIQELAEVLRVNPEVLLSQGPQRTPVGTVDGVDDIRAALACYDTPQAPEQTTGETRRQIGYAWLTYQHADYAQLARALPALLDVVQGARSPELLVQAYRITSALLVKLGEADLGWLAADRAMAAAKDDKTLAATAAVSVGQALRASGRDRLALTATLTGGNCILPPPTAASPSNPGDHEVGGPWRDQIPRQPHDRRSGAGSAGERAVGGTLLLQAALAAGGCGEHRRADELTDRAAGVAANLRGYDDQHRTSFGPVAVELTRVLLAAQRGDAAEAVRRHSTVVRREGWRRLPAEYRGAYLLDLARAYLQMGDLRGAARALVDADHVAPAEVRCRPLARTVIAEIARARPAPAGVARLATVVGLTR